MAGVTVLDASVLIAYLEGEGEHHAAAEALVAQEIYDNFGASRLNPCRRVRQPDTRCHRIGAGAAPYRAGARPVQIRLSRSRLALLAAASAPGRGPALTGPG
jgi:hypothetical protein